MKGIIREAKFEDLQEILELQRRAFHSVAVRAGNLRIPPMTQTLEQIQDEFLNSVFLVCEDQGRIVGSVRAHVTSENVCHLGRLMTEPEHQGQGIGTALMNEIEQRMRECARFELFTGEDFTEIVRLYHKLGYIVTRKEDMDSVPMVFMMKTNPPDKSAWAPSHRVHEFEGFAYSPPHRCGREGGFRGVER